MYRRVGLICLPFLKFDFTEPICSTKRPSNSIRDKRFNPLRRLAFRFEHTRTHMTESEVSAAKMTRSSRSIRAHTIQHEYRSEFPHDEKISTRIRPVCMCELKIHNGLGNNTRVCKYTMGDSSGREGEKTDSLDDSLLHAVGHRRRARFTLAACVFVYVDIDEQQQLELSCGGRLFIYISSLAHGHFGELPAFWRAIRKVRPLPAGALARVYTRHRGRKSAADKTVVSSVCLYTCMVYMYRRERRIGWTSLPD